MHGGGIPRDMSGSSSEGASTVRGRKTWDVILRARRLAVAPEGSGKEPVTRFFARAFYGSRSLCRVRAITFFAFSP